MSDTNQPDTSKPIESNSLAVKYRPQALSDLVGNESLKAQISGWLKQRRFPNALLVTGEFGSGKTTIGRLIARLANCEHGNACGQCISCKTPLDAHPDYHEINFADSRGIDDVRALLQQARYAPKFNMRVIMGDEAHGLSPAAAQALLKGLEEPPPKTMWVLSTNLANKVLPTIASRCVKLELKPPSVMELVKYLVHIARKEGFQFDKEKHLDTFKEIAKLSGGHVRNAVQMLESLLAAYASGDEASIKSVIEDFTLSSEQSLDNLALDAAIAMFKGNYRALLKSLQQAESNIRPFLYKLRFLLDITMSAHAGIARYTTPNVKEFMRRVPESKDFALLGSLQRSLASVEQTMNTVPGCDERIALQSELIEFTQTASGASRH